MAESTSNVPEHNESAPEHGEWAEYPGRTLGVVALVLSFFSQIPALIMGIIAWVWSNKVGRSNVPAKVAVAVSATLLVLIILAVVGWTALLVSFGAEFDDWEMGGGRFLD